MHDPADDAPIIDATGARLIVRKQRLDHRPLPIAQPKLVRNLKAPSLASLNHHRQTISML
jgi:hypothetical protein